ncbi:MAG TPA: hypothetical protein VNZ43_11055 [Sphingomonadaceae bacterium]|jgi:hypothetical protein|nr:hypothetical protein [Sphingomonadaceae bacterium]
MSGPDLRRRRSNGAIFAVPILIALLSLIGLVSALIGDGAADVASWIALAVPVAAVFWAMRARRS